MNWSSNRRHFLSIAGSIAGWLTAAVIGKSEAKDPKQDQRKKRNSAGNGGYVLPSELEAYSKLSLVLGRISDRSVTVSALARENLECYFEYGTASGKYDQKSKQLRLPAGQPLETVFEELKPNTEYFYRVHYRKTGERIFQSRPECRFHTQRSVGSTFTFAIQGDSHPERPQMSEPNLYARTLQLAAAARPDFYICMGDDFSVNKVRTVNAESLTEPYLLQRPFLGLIGQTAPVFLVNGNHEQASLFNYKQTDVRHEVAIGVQNARNKFYPTPSPSAFYTGNTEPLKAIGLLKDYYAWTWGDALFVVLDNYWHSESLVDTGYQAGDGKKDGDGKKNRNWWDITMGDAQYQWFKKTLEQSKAKYKFVFAHHVLGSGRGGIEASELYEWGGKNRRGENEFKQRRPKWEMPVHQLMVKHGVTIFFQGHDHLYACQERDNVVYQEVPIPADHTYTAFNEDAYKSGKKLPNAGFLRVTVSPEQVKVDYVRSYLPKDENGQRKTGDIAHSYTIKSMSKDA